MRLFRITDEAGTSGEVVVQAHQVAEALRPWYPDAPAEVYEQVQQLQDALSRDQWTGADQYLGVRVDPVDPDDLPEETR